MNKKLLIVIPYRNREEHLTKFIDYIIPATQNQNIECDIVVIEQNDNNPFNRGLLCNCGFFFYHHKYDYVCIHDVDMIGEPFDYSYVDKPTHLCGFIKMKNELYKECFPKYFGGVVLFPNDLFLKINGFSNNYWGWGCEDDNLRIRCNIFNIETKRKNCKFYTLDHKKNYEPISYKKNCKTLISSIRLPIDEKINTTLNDGLNNLENCIKTKSVSETKNFTLLKIQTKYEE